MFVVEEKLFTRGEDKLCPAIDALQYPVLEFHASSFGPAHSRDLRSRVRARPLFYGYPGFEPDPARGRLCGLLLDDRNQKLRGW